MFCLPIPDSRRDNTKNVIFMENEEILEVQDTFNEDDLDILVEDGEIENIEIAEENVEEVANNGNENE